MIIKILKKQFGTVSGRKRVEALSGTLLLVFLLEHFCGNALLLLIDPAPYLWYTEVMGSSIIVRILEVALFATFGIHIGVGLYMRLAYLRLKKRVVSLKPPRSISSRFVGVTGAIILLFLIVHLYTFFIPNRIIGGQELDLYQAAHSAFSNIWYMTFYALCMVMLSYHLHHGVRSAFTTVRPFPPRYMPLFIKVVSVASIFAPLGLAYICIHVYLKSM